MLHPGNLNLYKNMDFRYLPGAAPTGHHTLYNTRVRPLGGRDAGACVYWSHTSVVCVDSVVGVGDIWGTPDPQNLYLFVFSGTS